MNNKRLLIFAGAGASFGVDRKQFPTTIGFRESLPPDITGNHLFQQVENFLEHERKEQPPFDIEKILWELGEFERALERFNAAGSMSEYLFRTGNLGTVGITVNHQQIQNQFANVAAHLKALQDQIFNRVYQLYANSPEISKLEANWLPLLRWAREKYDSVEIVTTNYDLVIETALLEVPLVDTARRGGEIRPILDTECWKANGASFARGGSNPGKKGLLTKLHGSVDWTYAMQAGANNTPLIRVGQPDPHGGHNTRTIIYPGFKGTPTKEPFALFHKHLAKVWRECSHAVFVGFAFRDDYLNSIFGTERQESRPVAVIDPAPRRPEDYPAFDEVTYLKQGFGDESLVGKLEGWFSTFD